MLFRSSKPVGPVVEIFHPSAISGLYDVLGAVEVSVFGHYLHLPEPIAKQVFTYSPTEKEALAPPTIRVLNKYASGWMIKYQDEIALFTLLTALTIQKINVAKILAKSQSGSTVDRGSQVENDENGQKEGAGRVPPN